MTGDIELNNYPKHITMPTPLGVSSIIRAKRCSKCSSIKFVNDKDFTLCFDCRPLPEHIITV